MLAALKRYQVLGLEVEWCRLNGTIHPQCRGHAIVTVPREVWEEARNVLPKLNGYVQWVDSVSVVPSDRVSRTVQWAPH